MANISQIDYSLFDRPEVLSLLFHPREEWGVSMESDNAQDLLIPVEGGLVVGARFHYKEKKEPVILFFHGNGEIVADYNDLGPMYLNIGVNFFPVDYRGYGKSTGTPTVTGMMRDCHIIFEYVTKHLKENDFTGPLIIMGRSLGSASALELANSYEDKIDGLIIESGFAYAIPLLKLLGVNVEALDR